MRLPADYAERVYAGVLGKIIGVYLGRPFEGWTHARIDAELGEISGFVHQRLGVPLVVTDDDIAGTFTFPRAFADHGYRPDLTCAQIGQTWLNHIVPERSHLWWGGMGNSTEHTAYLRLRQGVPAPDSGSMALNGAGVAEQIGAQIFIDGWAMLAPGDPERAADLARRAASVSHDGVAVEAAQVIAAMEALAFGDPEISHWLETATALLPADSPLRRLITDIRDWHAGDGDWRHTRVRIEERYGYHRYPGACHVMPNHGLIHLALLYGTGDFHRSLRIVNTSGWDTDCNSGNVGCLLGIRNGLAAFTDGPDWRGPVADRLFLPGADGGRAVTDAVQEADHLVDTARRLAGLPPARPKGGARFHFSYPGSVQGFAAEAQGVGNARLELANTPIAGLGSERGLALRFAGLEGGGQARAATPTFIPPDALGMGGYALLASPTLYPGQTVRAQVAAAPANHGPVRCRLALRHYGAGDGLVPVGGPALQLPPGARHTCVWTIPDTGGAPIADVGLELLGGSAGPGILHLEWLTWEGTPQTTLGRAPGTLWRRAWVASVDQWGEGGPDRPYRLIQNHGCGMAIQGTREWTDLTVDADCVVHLARAAGLAIRVQGLCRHYALLLVERRLLRLVRVLGDETVLAQATFPWSFERPYRLTLGARGRHLWGAVDGEALLEVEDPDPTLDAGAIALVCAEGHIEVGPVRLGRDAAGVSAGARPAG